jgi:predicted transcriptional regulator
MTPEALIERISGALLQDGPLWRAKRIAAGLTLGDASKRAKIPLVSLSNVERGLELPSIAEAQRLLKLYRGGGA